MPGLLIVHKNIKKILTYDSREIMISENTCYIMIRDHI